jgi:hypothetical protein
MEMWMESSTRGRFIIEENWYLFNISIKDTFVYSC